jgi:hypothetical protein
VVSVTVPYCRILGFLVQGDSNNNNNNNSVALVRERTIPTERPPLVGEVSAKILSGQRDGSLLPYSRLSISWR